MNCLGGLSLTKAPERWDASWDNNVKARDSPMSGLEFLLPIGRGTATRVKAIRRARHLRRGLGLRAIGFDERHYDFRTLHVAFVNPVFAAKQMVTADHIGHGDLGSTSSPAGTDRIRHDGRRAGRP
jgi:hypothetical protein